MPKLDYIVDVNDCFEFILSNETNPLIESEIIIFG